MKYFSCLLIGPPGSGKTKAASTAPGPVLFLDIDNKLHRMQNISDKLKSGQVIQWPIDDPLSAMTLSKLAGINPKPGASVTQVQPKGYFTCRYDTET